MKSGKGGERKTIAFGKARPLKMNSRRIGKGLIGKRGALEKKARAGGGMKKNRPQKKEGNKKIHWTVFAPQGTERMRKIKEKRGGGILIWKAEKKYFGPQRNGSLLRKIRLHRLEH